MDSLLFWLNPARWAQWVQDNPLVALAIAAPLGAIVIWRAVRGGMALRRALINVAGIGLIVWGTLWFADWVKPSLTPSDLFTSPLVGPQAVDVVKVARKTIEKTATYTGSVNPYEQVTLRARVDGYVEEVAVTAGDIVEQGQILARIETSNLQPKLDEARAELSFLKAELERDERLFQGDGITQSQLALSRSKVERAAAKAALLRTRIGYAVIRAPSAGWVAKRGVDPGQYVRQGDHIVAYDRLKQVRIRFNVAVRDLPQITPGSTVVIAFPDIPASAFQDTDLAEVQGRGLGSATLRAEVTAVFPRVDEKSRLGVVEVVLPNPRLVLKTNTYVVGSFVTERVEDVWVVPERALTMMPGGKTVIFLAPASADQGRVEMREVEVGLRNGGEAQILNGLEGTGYVVVAGNRSLVDGQIVSVLSRRETVVGSR